MSGCGLVAASALEKMDLQDRIGGSPLPLLMKVLFCHFLETLAIIGNLPPKLFQLVTKANPAQYMKNVRTFFSQNQFF